MKALLLVVRSAYQLSEYVLERKSLFTALSLHRLDSQSVAMAMAVMCSDIDLGQGVSITHTFWWT